MKLLKISTFCKKIKILLIIILLFTSSCTRNWEKDIEPFIKLNKYLSNNYKVHYASVIKVNSLILLFPKTKYLVKDLIDNFDLTEVQFYYLDDNKSQLCIAYQLGVSSEKPFRYLLYSNSKKHKSSFEHTEQFYECGKRKEIDSLWTLVTITDCFD